MTRTNFTTLSFILVATMTPRAARADEAVEKRVEQLLSQMTLEEKIDYVGGYKDMHVRAIPRLGMREIKMSDGPCGVRTWGKTTAYPATVGLAASWNPELAAEFGRSIARDAKARGVHIWLAPGVNLARQPQCGRNFEYVGEDPYLASQIAVAIIKSVQMGGVAATIKHLVANEQEADRHTVSSKVDERTLRELYLRPFEAAIKDAGVWCVMNAYNRLNGPHCSEHPWLLTDLVKKEWGFRGLVMSDWGSVYSTAGPIKAGMDIEMPNGKFLNRDAIMPLLKDGTVTEAQLDEMVRRILRVAVSMGFFDRDQKDETIPLDDPASAAVALKMAREAIVLLKNEKNALPLDPAKPQRIMLIGPNADPAVTGGGGSSYAETFSTVSVLEAVKSQAGAAEIDWRRSPQNVDREAYLFNEYLQPAPSDAPGLRGEYFANMELAGEPAVVRTDERVNFEWWSEGPAKGIGPDNFSVRWTGRVKPGRGGPHTLVARSDDGMRVWVDGKLLIDMWRDQGSTTERAAIAFEAGRTYDLKIEYYERSGGAIAQFGFVGADAMEREAASDDEVRTADAVVACVGFTHETESEGFDRPFDLPDAQERLLRRLVALNPRTIVVVNSGAGINMSAWADKAAAIVQAWYPGQNGNTAVAEVLFGVTNPTGKLPTTFPKTLDGSYVMKGYPPAKDGDFAYPEGIFMGYRWYDQNKLEPLFPFGHGLSYTTFKLSGLHIQRGTGDSVATVTAAVENTGTRPGAEVLQLYVHDVESSLPRPVRELKGFRKVQLSPGERKVVSFVVRKDDLAFFDPGTHKWTVESGAFEFSVGTSSRELPLHGTHEYRPAD